MRLIATVLSIIIFLSFGCKKDNAVPTQPSNTDSTNIVDSTDTSAHKKFRLVEIKSSFKADTGENYTLGVFTYNNNGMLRAIEQIDVTDGVPDPDPLVETYEYQGGKLMSATWKEYNRVTRIRKMIYDNDRLSGIEYYIPDTLYSISEIKWINDNLEEIKTTSVSGDAYSIEKFEYIAGQKNIKMYTSTEYTNTTPGGREVAYFFGAKYDDHPSPISTIKGLPEGYAPIFWIIYEVTPNNITEFNLGTTFALTYNEYNMLVKSESNYDVVEYKYEEY